MAVEKKGKKGSSPNVYKYFKIDGDKVTVDFEKAGQKKLLLNFIEKI